MNNAYSAAVAVLALIFGAGPALAQDVPEPVYFTTAGWNMAPIEATIDSESQTASVGDLLFQQNLKSASVAVLASGLSVSLPSAFYSSARQAVFDPGSEFFQLTGVGDSQIFCPGAASSRGAGGGPIRVCLYDREADGVFDSVCWMPLARNNVFAGMMVTEGIGAQERSVSVPYRLDPNADTPLMVAGPIITRSALGAYRVTLGVRDHGDTVGFTSGAPNNARVQNSDEPQSAQAVYFRAADMPLTMMLGGARIQIEAIEGNQVRYRILSGFDPPLTFDIGYNRPLPLDAERTPRTGGQ